MRETRREIKSFSAESREQIVELVVRADPNPFNRVTGAHAHGAILFADTNRPDVTAALKFFETQRWMIRVGRKKLIRQPRPGFDGRSKLLVSTPEGGPDLGDHSLDGSSGSAAPSRKDAAANCSSFG